MCVYAPPGFDAGSAIRPDAGGESNVDGSASADAGEPSSMDAGDASMNAGDTGTPGPLSSTVDGDRLFVTSTEPPTWRIEFAIGDGAPGGGTAIALHIPHDSTTSLVESRPGQQCCSGLGLDNLEWRFQPAGAAIGTRADSGTQSTVESFRWVEQSADRMAFELIGSWPGVRRFTKTVEITPEGYSARVSAEYSGTTGETSTWWILSLFDRDTIDASASTVRDADTASVALPFTTPTRALPSGIEPPYQVVFPAATPSASVELTVSQVADDSSSANFYALRNPDTDPSPIGPYYMFYPLWRGTLAATNYTFDYAWRILPTP